MPIRRSILHALAAALLLAGVMTLGDFVWAVFHVRHRALYGVAHGAVMCLVIGAVVGARVGRIVMGTVAGPFIGITAAAMFYLLAPMMRMSAMLPAWMLFWTLFAILQRQLSAEDVRDSARSVAVRGLTAAVLSGLAFYAISGIWTRHEPAGPNYVVHFASWGIAFLPGFVALFAARRTARP